MPARTFIVIVPQMAWCNIPSSPTNHLHTHTSHAHFALQGQCAFPGMLFGHHSHVRELSIVVWYLRFAKREDWAKVLRLLQNWGWAGNTVLMSNGNNGAAHDKSYFDRTLVCTFWRKHRNQNERTVWKLLYMSSYPYTSSRVVLSPHVCLPLSSHTCLRS